MPKCSYRGKKCVQLMMAGLVLGTAVGVGGCASHDSSGSEEVGLANPAALYCESVGGRTLIVENSEGQSGYCILPDGERVDQWEFYRINHPA